MADRYLLAKALSDIRDAVARIRDVLPADADTFAPARSALEVVTLNLFAGFALLAGTTRQNQPQALLKNMSDKARAVKSCLRFGATSSIWDA